MTKKLTFLKHSLLALLFVSLFSFEVSAQQWDTVGVAGFSPGNTSYNQIQVYNDTVYVAFIDAANSDKVTVMRYDGFSWTLVGSAGFSVGVADQVNFKINNLGELYVAFNDAANSNGITVMKYTNGSWVVVGAPNLSNGISSLSDLAFDSTNVPYIAYFYAGNIPTSYSLRVRKFDGTNWVVVGAPIGSTPAPQGAPNYPNLGFYINGEPFIVYSVGGTHRAKRFAGANWVDVGSFVGASGSGGYKQDLVFDSNGIPYILSANSNSDLFVAANSSIIYWHSVGGSFGSANGNYPTIVIDDNDQLYVTQKENNGSDVISVYTYNGTSWGLLGGTTANTGTSTHVNSTISDNVLYIIFTDGVLGKSTVMKYELTTNINQIPTLNKDITIYPNPTKGQLNIEGVEGIESIRILTMDGKVMETITTNSNTISVETLPQGVYTIEVITTEGTGYKNFVKQ